MVYVPVPMSAVALAISSVPSGARLALALDGTRNPSQMPVAMP